jgi:hypothetical protein
MKSVLRVAVVWGGLLLPAAGIAAPHRPDQIEDHPEWLSCSVSSDCISVQLGCYYWQAINKTYSSRATAGVACTKSNPPGPQPTTHCEDHKCVNDPFTVAVWDHLEPYQKFSVVSRRAEACRPGPNPIPSPDDAAKIYVYETAMDDAIHSNRFPDTALIDDAVKQIVPCKELIAWEKGQRKWQAVQVKENRARRVRVEDVYPVYPLDALYPVLIQYARTFQRCGQNSSRAGVTFAGDLNIQFSIHPGGAVELDSSRTTYPAVAYMRPFIECAESAFRKILFPAPSAGQPIAVKVLIQITP